ncbi:MAG: hypothetical protein M3500_15110 [Actinomycetota bacterium]|nr:hypothetical protein [Actinomycetota bacterium]
MRIRARVELQIGHVEYDAAAPTVRVGDRYLPAELFVAFPSDARGPALRMRLAVVNGVPQCRELTIESKDTGREVRTADLRAVTLETWIEDLFAVVSQRIVSEKDGIVSTVSGESPLRMAEAAKVVQRARSASRQVITEETIREVARVYRANATRRPTQAVAKAFGVQHRTASKYVRRARDLGLLPETTAGKVTV